MFANLEYPTFETTLPVSKKIATFRPFNVKEMRTLMIQAEDKREGGMVIKTIKTCAPDVNISELSQADKEFLYLQIRAKAIGESIDLGHKCECGKTNRFNLNFEKDLKVTGKKTEDTITVANGYVVKMKIPSATLVAAMEENKTIETVNAVLVDCIDMIVYGEEVFTSADLEDKDKIEFVEKLIDIDFSKMESWVLHQPKLYATKDYKCTGCGKENHVVVSGLLSFF